MARLIHLISRSLDRIGVRDGSRRQLVTAASGNFVIIVSSKILGFASTLILAKLLGAEGLGTYALALAITNLITSLGTASVNQLIVKTVAGYHALQQWSLFLGLLCRARQLNITVTLVLAACVGFAAWHLIERDTSQLRLTLLIALIIAPIQGLLYLNSATLQGLRKVVLAQLPPRLIWPAMFFALLLIGYFVPQIKISAPLAMAAQAVTLIMTWIIALSLLRPCIPSEVKTAMPQYDTMNWLRASFPFLAIGVLYKVNMEAATLLLGMIAGPEEVGVYRPAASIALLLMFGAEAVNMTINPTLARRYALGQTAGFKRLSVIIAWAGFGIAILGAAIAIPFGEMILLIFGPSFVEGTTALAILCVGKVISAAFGQPGALLQMTDRQSIVMRGMFWAAGTNVILNIALIPQFGATGAAIAVASGDLVLNIHNMLAARRELAVNTTIFALRLRTIGTV